MKNFLREPLVHFLILGTLIFLAYGWLSPDTDDPKQIRVSRGTQNHLFGVFSRTWQRPPTQQEFEGLMQEWIRKEIAFREALPMGLEKGDTVIRRRMRQKLEMLTDEIVGPDRTFQGGIIDSPGKQSRKIRS